MLIQTFNGNLVISFHLKKRFFNFILLPLSLIFFSNYASANEVPVVNLTSSEASGAQINSNIGDNNSPISNLIDTSQLSMAQRVTRLEQQLNGIAQMNLPQQIAELQQQIQQLNGQLEELSHQLDVQSRTQQHVEALPPAPPPTPAYATPPSSGQIVPTVTPNNALPAAAKTDAAAYQAALNLLTNKQYADALTAFQAYLRTHPDGQFVANAHYWLGEIYFQQRNLRQSELEFNLVIQQYSTSNKVADAELRLAVLHAQQGKTEQAKQELKTVTLRYPGTPAAQLATIQLQQLNGQ